MLPHVRFLGIAITAAIVLSPTTFAETDASTLDQTSPSSSATDQGDTGETEEKTVCAALQGRERALCALRMNLQKQGMEIPTCGAEEQNYGLAHAYCAIKEKIDQKESETTAKKQHLERRILKKALKVNLKERMGGVKEQWKTEKKELKRTLKEKREETKSTLKQLRDATREKMKSLREDKQRGMKGATTLQGVKEEGELRAWLRARRAHTQPFRGERTGVRRQTGKVVQTPRSAHETGEKWLKMRMKERVREELPTVGPRKTTEE